MNVIRATVLGMCFGVRDALDLARNLDEPQSVTVWGQIVHNPQVTAELHARGFRQTHRPDASDVPETARVLVTAHGLGQRERRRLESHGKSLVDTTCPLVERVHDAALRLEREGRHVVVVGREDHVEVRGIVAELSAYTVIEHPDAATTLPSGRVGVVAQTTIPPERFAAVVERLRSENPAADIVAVDTVCDPTRRRRDAVRALAGQVDAVVVVGGRNSNNTRELSELVTALGVPAFQIEGPDDLDVDGLRAFDTIGLTAGTSTPDATIDEVESRLRALPPR